MRRGAEIVQCKFEEDKAGAMRYVLACGREVRSRRGGRLFGFKSHFAGPINDAVELYFFSGCYVGLNPIEDGITNVCGIGPENFLQFHEFKFDSIVNSFSRLKERLRPLTRSMRWYSAGPLVFERRFDAREGVYAAGDALCFVDPFTGSGLLSSVITGRLAGLAAAKGTATGAYAADCRRRIGRPFLASSLIRKMLANGWAERLAPFVPASWIVHITRPGHVL